MRKTTVVNLRRDVFDVYIGRAGQGNDGYFGNPFVLQAGETRGSTIERYRVWFLNRIANDPVFKKRVEKLHGKTLGCFCKPLACHGDVIIEYLGG